MSHLHTERLAALADESPTPAEQAHLAACAECTRERAAYASMLDIAKMSPRISAPLTSWESLSPALREAGVIPGLDAGRRLEPRRGRTVTRVWSQAAAAVVLLAGGVLVGRATATEPASGTVATNATSEVIPQFSSLHDAEQERSTAELRYQAAVTYIAQHDTTSLATERALQARVTALGDVRATVTEALSETPYDPVFRNLYLAVTGQQAATIRQLNTGLPSSVRHTVY